MGLQIDVNRIYTSTHWQMMIEFIFESKGKYWTLESTCKKWSLESIRKYWSLESTYKY